jgi:adenylate cyclase
MQAALYLTATRGFGAPEARICYERAESLCHSLNRPLLLYSALKGQWNYSLVTDKLTATMEIAKRIYSLAQEQNDPALLISANRALACTSYFLGEFEPTRHYAVRALKVWRSVGARSPVEEVDPPEVACLIDKAQSEWHLGEIASCERTMAEAISLANELNNMHGVAEALYFAACLCHYQRNPAEVERLATELIELSTRQNFVFWLAGGTVLRGWARSASGHATEGISWIENGIGGWRASGSTIGLPFYLVLKAEALHVADRTSEALETIREAETLAERLEERYWSAELHRLRGVFLAALGAEETQIEASFYDAIRIAQEQKSVSLEKRAEATYAEYLRQKTSEPGGCGFRLRLW